jgi:nucleoside-diphosphate-sugar epimerase
MRAFVTGATGFLGGRLVAKLQERGDDVVALVRSRRRGSHLHVELVKGDLSDRGKLQQAMEGADAVFHLAARYEVGIPASERDAMYETNVHGTANVLDAAWDAQVPRIVYVSTVNVFGNTRGEIVDEAYERPGGDYVSAYDWTKHVAQEIARERIELGAPIVIVQPGAIYGPGDHSELGDQLEQVRAGKLRFRALSGVGVNALHVDDAVDGILLAYEHGQIGESYVLGGEITTLDEMLEVVARLSGQKAPRLRLPAAAIRLATPIGPLVGRVMGTGPNLRELISASDGVTYWATDQKARSELGYAPRDLETGLADLLAR